MNESSNSLVVLFEDNGMTPAEIALSEGVDELAVKAVLLRHSSVYRKTLPKDEKKELFDDTTLQLAAETLTSLLNSEDDSVQLRAATYIIDEKKGRHDNVVKNLFGASGGSSNVFIITQQLARAREAIAASEKKSNLLGAPSQVLEAEVVK